MGFRVLMDYVAAGPVEEHIRRVMNRATLGGHSASERRLREIYENSMKHLHTGGDSKEFGGPIYLGQFVYKTCTQSPAFSPRHTRIKPTL
jgi:hypothetical protein